MGKSEMSEGEVVTTYYEKKIGKTVYRVTSVYLGKIELKTAIEDLTVRRILQELRAEDMRSN